MKKFCLVIVSLIVLMSFVGCEKADPDPYIPSTNTDAATTQITIEEGNIVARGESEFFKSTITYFFEEGVYAYTQSETYYVDPASSEIAYQGALDSGVYEDVTLEEQTVSFKADDSYIFEGMSVETAASYLAGSVLF
ncbi:MAG: hypothetical protein RBS51_03870 [Anaerovoracaceae bacterium]|jgi:hypothetical protein|nr:hypothetical protein [Anaerovoracaceae bacterium]